MKTSRSTVTKQSKQGMSHKPKPEVRDDLDSRKRKDANSKKSPKKSAKEE